MLMTNKNITNNMIKKEIIINHTMINRIKIKIHRNLLEIRKRKAKEKLKRKIKKKRVKMMNKR